MAVMTLTTLVLRGVSVSSDGVAGAMRLGVGYQGQQEPSVPFSKRHLPGNPWNPIEVEPRRHDRADRRDQRVADRAGRPACWTGVPSCRTSKRSTFAGTSTASTRGK